MCAAARHLAFLGQGTWRTGLFDRTSPDKESSEVPLSGAARGFETVAP